MSKSKAEANKIKFSKSLFDDRRTRVVHHHVKAEETAEGWVQTVLAAEGVVQSAEEQLRIALDDLERIAAGVLERNGLTISEAVTMSANTPPGRAGRIAAGVQAVRRTLVSPEATEAALTMYGMMQQFAAESVDQWREEVRRGVSSVKNQRIGAESGKESENCVAVAKYLVQVYGSDTKPSKMWAKVRDNPEKKPPVWDMAGMAVKISADGKKISCGSDSRTKEVFLKSYLKPAREAAAKG